MMILKSLSRHVRSLDGASLTVFQLGIVGVFCLLISGVATAANSVASDERSLLINSNRRLVETKVFVRLPLQDENNEQTAKSEKAVESSGKGLENGVGHEDRRHQSGKNLQNGEEDADQHQRNEHRSKDELNPESEQTKLLPRSQQQKVKQEEQKLQEEKQDHVQESQEKGKIRDNDASQEANMRLEQKMEMVGNNPSQNHELKQEPQGEKFKLDIEPEEEEELQQRREEKQPQQRSEGNQNGGSDKREEDELAEEDEEHFEFPEAQLLGPAIKDWDKQRAEWLQAHPHMRLTPEGKPRVLMMTGSNPAPCRSPAGDNFYVHSFKLKIDYARIHKYEIFYNFVLWDPLFSDFWVKLPTLRNMMLTHPEIEWFFWVDSDAVFTDMTYEAPLDSFEGYNMVMEGWMGMLIEKQSWLAANDGVVLIRNCQWTLDLIDKWAPMGPDGSIRKAAGKMLTKFFTDRLECPADDQSALAYLMIKDESVRSKVKLLENVRMSGYWKDLVDSYERLMEESHPGLGDDRWPWVTHFTGCGLCNRETDDPQMQKCLADFQRAFNFADNQVLAHWGFQHDSLNDPTTSVIRVRNETARPLDYLDLNPWADRMAKVAGG